ncbi:MAG: S8 family peptidase [Deltaproteobacteria bacterium]|nr:S8 family peptidase [Deltaproteobacteria bacterium]
MPSKFSFVRAWWPFGTTLVVGLWWFHPGTELAQQRQATASAERAAELAAAAEQSPNTLIVDFRDDVTADVLARNGLTEEAISAASDTDKLYRVRFASRGERDAAFERLAADPSVQGVDYDVEAIIPPDEAFAVAAPPPSLAACHENAGEAKVGFPNDPCFAFQWHFNQINLKQAWKRSQGEGVVVAVIDTGVSRVGDLANTKFVEGYNFVDNNKDASDDHGHGTHVAGTIAQSTNNGLGVSGIAFKASIMPLKVLSARGSGSMAAIAQAIRWAADHGANVINMSLGGPFPVGSIHSAVKYARKKGVVVVAAAGNDGRGRVSYPGKYPEVIGVAATQFDEATTFYSNWGKTVDIAAPGGNVRVDQNGDGQPDGVLQNTIVPGNTSKQDYLWFMGTSMASPHVAGVAALIMSAGVTQPDAVDALLMGTARTPKSSAKAAGDERINDHYGAGIVDADKALARAQETRGGGALAFAGTLAFAVTSSLRRRRRLEAGSRGRFVAGVLLGSSGLFVVPLLLAWFGLSAPAAFAPLFEGIPAGLAMWLAHVWGASAHGTPLFISAALPALGVAVGLSVRSLRPALGGFALGVAGLLLFLVCSGSVDITWVPTHFEHVFLLANAALAAILGALTLTKD